MPLTAIFLVCLSAGIHATWNLLAHSQQKLNGNLFFRCQIISGFAILVPELVAELQSDHFSVAIWSALLVAGVLNGIYYFGLTMGYRNGNFTVIYPVSRALPLLFLAGFDIFRGQEPSLLGWLGIILVVVGCAIAPLQSLQKIALSDYWNEATVWIFVIALATAGYSIVDKVAVEILPLGNVAELARFQLLQALFIAPCLWLILRFIDKKQEHEPNELQVFKPTSSEVSLKSLVSLLADWQPAIIFSIFVLGSYIFMLWAYQLSPYVSYLAGLRQISIVFGVVIGVFILREPSPKLRIGAALLITLGILCISLTSA